MASVGSRLKAELDRSVFKDDPTWSCKGRDGRTGVHGLIQYPAMMVPAMQRDLLAALRTVDTNIQRVGDPFVGSGTALTESLLLGCDFSGYDINPLAILVSRVKAGPFDVRSLQFFADYLGHAIAADTSRSYAVEFQAQKKWFLKSNSIQLSRIRRAIETIPDLSARRFFWVAMAETIRQCSNSRTTTYKLHIRIDTEISGLDGVALSIFERVVDKNLGLMRHEEARLNQAQLLTDGAAYTGNISLQLGDICQLGRSTATPQLDVIMTSPPYGDNRTTVPYGQFSYLALQWIPLSDIDTHLTSEVLQSTMTIDTKSLGGTTRNADAAAEELCDISPAFKKIYRQLSDIADGGDGKGRLTSFCRDLGKAVNAISKHVRPGGYLAWTIGERRIRGLSVPLALILGDIHEAQGAHSIGQYERAIHTKRMPTKNNTSALMQTEQICIYQMA